MQPGHESAIRARDPTTGALDPFPQCRRTTLTPREHEVLALMAEGHTNAAIARELVVMQGAVEKHVSSIFPTLDLPASDHDHRRVLAVLAFLRAGGG